MSSSSTSSPSMATINPGYRFLIYYTIAGAGGFGISMFYPQLFAEMGIHPSLTAHIEDYDVWYRCLGSLWLSLFAGASLAVYTDDPVRFAPLFLSQMVYKSIWIITTVLPRLFAGDLHWFDGLSGAIMLSFVILDILFVPWDYILNGKVPATTKKAV